MDCLLKIREISNELNPSEQKIANYILQFPDDCVGLSVKELAEKSHSSKAAVIRFCKSLGFSGYRDLTVQLSANLATLKMSRQDEAFSDVRPGDDIESIARGITAFSSRALEDTLSIMNMDDLQRVVEILNNAERIDFFGVGASAIVAMDAQEKFMRIRKQGHAYLDVHLQVTTAATMKAGDVAVVFSYSGKTRETFVAANTAKQNGATIISVTRYGSNPINEIADIKLYVSSPETSIRSGATASRIAQLNLVDILYIGVVSASFNKVKKYLQSTREATNSLQIK